MTRLVWDEIGTRTYEAGISHGVLYSPTGAVVPWNGITALSENFTSVSEPVYVDGQKTLDRLVYGDFAGHISAITYPDQLDFLTGIVESISGVAVHNQKPKPFSISFRTTKGDDVTGPDAGYYIHVLYNILAIADDIGYVTDSNSVAPIEFGWTLTTIPEAVTGFRATAHVILDSTELDPDLLGPIEDQLYGTSSTAPMLPSLNTMTQTVIYAGRITITDNGDGTWTAAGPDSNVYMLSGTQFQIDGVNATYSDPYTYDITTTIL